MTNRIRLCFLPACGGEIPAAKRADAKYCSERCRKLAKRARMSPEALESRLDRQRAYNRTRTYRHSPERAAANYQRNKANISEGQRRWVSQNRERVRDNQARWYRENRERLLARQREWVATNREQANEFYRARRAAKRRSNAGPLTVEKLEARRAYYGGRCWMCGSPATAMDHVKPIARGGPHLPANLRPACAPCNSRKNARWYGPKSLSVFLRQ